MRRHLQYLKYVLRHKWYVFLAGCRLGIPLLALVHDWSKFKPSEWLPYARTFYSSSGVGQYEPESGGMDVAWNAHIHRNKHHWQYWVLVRDNGDIDCLPMPGKYRLEMLADWIGAAKAQGNPDLLGWYKDRSENIMLHPETKLWLNSQMGYHFDFKNDGSSIIYFECPFCSGYNGHEDDGITTVNCTSSCGKSIDMYSIDPDEMCSMPKKTE